MKYFSKDNCCFTGAEKKVSVSPAITQVSTADIAGGAERIALDVHAKLLERGYQATLAIGHQYAHYPNTVLIPHDEHRNWHSRAIESLMPKSTGPHAPLSQKQIRVRRALKSVSNPLRTIRTLRGYDDFDFPGTHSIPNLSPHAPDVLHLHNLHGNYFDLRELPFLCNTTPVMLTAHDTWLASGHCAYSVDCNRYLTGCGQCPHLNYLPPAHGDRTHANWIQKRSIFQNPDTQIHLVSPSQWTIDVLQDSIFCDAIASTTLIPNGVDTEVFKPEDKFVARQKLGINPESFMLTFSLASESNPYKDLKTIKEALPMIATKAPDTDIIFVAIGANESNTQAISGIEMRATGYLSDPYDVATYLQAADVHLHAAHAEVFCLAIIEAEACGTPVITTNVGGTADTLINNQTGLLVPRQAPAKMAEATVHLINDPVKLAAMSTAAAEHAHAHLTQNLMVSRYCDLYHQLSDK